MSVETLAVWRQLQHANPDLASPYFAPAFTQIVAGVRNEVEVAELVADGKVVALFPYHRGRFNFGSPVGEFISDYQGLICERDFTLAPQTLLKACGLFAWDFNQLLATQTSFSPFHHEQNSSPILDLSAGYEAYTRERREAGSEQIKKVANLMRRVEREVGPLNFVTHSADKDLLAQLLAWKTAQYRQNRWRDLFSIPWVRTVIEQIHATQTEEFAGMLSAIYAGERLLAVHFGMRSATVWHYWFPAYDPAYAKYSSGLILLLKMAESAPAMGIRTIDLGCGEHSYKERLMNGAVMVAQGSVERPSIVTATRRLVIPVCQLSFALRCGLSKTPIGAVARQIRARVRGPI